jgi:hypothetical protein
MYKRMPGGSPAPDSVTLRYKKVVGLGLTFQAINFAQGEFMGHRVRFNVPVDYMNQYFFWDRAKDDYRPTGRFLDEGRDDGDIDELPSFANFLEWSLGTQYTDIDGVEDALNYSSQALDTYNDSKRDPDVLNFATVDDLVTDDTTATADPATHYGANDLVMAYVLYKCFGSSAFDAEDIVYNLEDAFGMLSSKLLAEAVRDSLKEQDDLAVAIIDGDAEPKPGQRGKVDEMFRALLAADPKRFFLKGTQIEGLFETNYVGNDTDASGDRVATGNWCLKAGDIIEIPIKLVFTAPVTVLSVVDNPREPSSLSPEQPETVVIKGELTTADGKFDATADAWEMSDENLKAANRANIMSVRLQLLCSSPLNDDKRTYATSEVVDDDGVPAAVDFKIATQMNVVFYNSKYYPKQSAIAIVPVGGNGTYTYTSDDLPDGVVIDEATGVLTFNRLTEDDPPEEIDGIVPGRHAVKITVKSEDAAGDEVSVDVDLFITISDGTEATNVDAA